MPVFLLESQYVQGNMFLRIWRARRKGEKKNSKMPENDGGEKEDEIVRQLGLVKSNQRVG